jgi:hypothetical protein
MTLKVLEYAGALVAGALIVVPGALVHAETAGQRGGGGRAPAIVAGTSPVEAPATSAAEIVGKLLNPPAPDPDVPLPRPGLVERSEAPAPLTGPSLFGRQEPGGGVLGLRMPIPAERGATSGNTRYSPPSLSPEGSVLPSLQSR